MKKAIRIIAIVLVLASVLTVSALAASYSRTMLKDTNYTVFSGKTVTRSGVTISNLVAYYDDPDEDYGISFYLYSTNGSDLWGYKYISNGSSKTVGSSGAGSAYLIARNDSPDNLTVSFTYSY